MDRQFMRILMLTVLLPAGAAVGEAMHHEHAVFAGSDRLTGNGSVVTPIFPAEHVISSRIRIESTTRSDTAQSAHDPAGGGMPAFKKDL